MMGLIVAAILTVFLVPVVAGIVEVLLLPIGAALGIRRGGLWGFSICALVASGGGIAMVWLSSRVFGWLSGSTPLWAIVLLSLAEIAYGVHRIRGAFARFAATMENFGATTTTASARLYEITTETFEGRLAKNAVDSEIAWLVGNLTGIWVGAWLLGLL
jgi:hypothetical protein